MATQLRHKIAKVAIFFLRCSYFGEFIGFRVAIVMSHHLQMSRDTKPKANIVEKRWLGQLASKFQA